MHNEQVIATLSTEPTYSATNHGIKKETVATRTVVVLTDKGLREVITVRWYSGRSSSATVLYCSVWVHGSGSTEYWSGTGQTSGLGYCKLSASFIEACNPAGITFSHEIAGRGMGIVHEAMDGIIDALYAPATPRIIVSTG